MKRFPAPACALAAGLALCLAAGCAAARAPLTVAGCEIHLSRDSDIPARLVELIDAAGREVAVSTYGADLHSVLAALERAAGRGAQVALLADRPTPHLRRFALSPRRPALRGRALGHTKFGAVDRRVAWLGSFNLTFNSAYRHDDNLVVFHYPEIAGYLADGLPVLARGGPTPPPLSVQRDDLAVTVGFTPYCRPLLMAVLESAREEIFFSLFIFTDRELAGLLARKAGEGVRVSGVLERDSSFNRGMAASLERAGISVRWDRNHFLNHHKVFVIDRRVTVTGSYNPTGAAPGNQEISAVIENRAIASYYRDRLGARRF